MLTALIGRRIAGSWGLLAGLLVAIAPLSVDTTTVCRCDPVMLLAVLGAVYLALLAQDRQSNGWFVAAGAAAGIAAGVKGTGVSPRSYRCGSPRWRFASWPDRIKAGALALVAFAAAIAITNHFVWYDFPNLLIQLTLQVAITGAGHWDASLNPAGFYAMILDRFGTGQALTFAAVIFAIVTLATRRLSWWIR